MCGLSRLVDGLPIERGTISSIKIRRFVVCFSLIKASTWKLVYGYGMITSLLGEASVRVELRLAIGFAVWVWVYQSYYLETSMRLRYDHLPIGRGKRLDSG